MGFFSNVAKGWAQYVLPVSGTIAGGAVGGPVGAAVGGTLGSIPGGIIAAEEAERKQREANEANYQRQKEFAQHGVRWKVEDAKAAGIHPLAALGAQTQSYSASTVAEPTRDFSGMGQDISRAISATRTADERDMAALQIQGAKLDLEGKALDNQIKLSQLRKQSEVGPAFPGSQSFIPGQGDSGGRIANKAMERTASHKEMSYAEPGAINDVGWVRTKTGLVPVPSKDAKERTEDVMPHEWAHYIRNNIAPYFGSKNSKPPASALPKDAVKAGAKDWHWNGVAMEWQPTLPYKGKPRREAWDY